MTITIAQARLVLKDPHDCTDSRDELTLYQAFFDTLICRVGQEFVPHLATSWTVSDDACNWMFHIRDDVHFHDGTVCDANAVITSLKRLSRPDKGYTLGAPGVWHQYLGDTKFTAEGAGIVRIKLAKPLADLCDILVQCFIVAPSSIADLEAGKTDTPIGTGAYRAILVNPTEIVAERVDTHFSGIPNNAKIRWVLAANQSIRQTMLENNDVQIASDLSFSNSFLTEQSEHTYVKYLSPVAVIYVMNAAKGPLMDSKVRRALSLAIDREDLIANVVNGAAQPLLGFVSQVHFGAGKADAPKRDLVLAKKLLEEAGHKNGLTLEVDCPLRLPDESVELTNRLNDQLGEIGVSLNIHYHKDREAYAHMVRRKEIRDLCVFDSSPLSTFRVLYEKIDARIKGSWWQGYHNAAVEALLDEGRQNTNIIERAEIYSRAYAELQQDPAWLTLYNPLQILGMAGKHPNFHLPVDSVIDVFKLPHLS